MGIDVASFGDFFADKLFPIGKTQDISRLAQPRHQQTHKAGPAIEISAEELKSDVNNTSTQSGKGRRHGPKEEEPINCLVYKDPFSATYKKYIFTEDGKYLLGGMMVGDVGDFVKLVALVKKKVSALNMSSSQVNSPSLESFRGSPITANSRLKER